MDLRGVVNDFPAKIVSRMQSGRVGYNEAVLRLEQNLRRIKIPGETSQSLFYRGYDIRFGVEGKRVWVRLETYKPGERTFEIDVLQDALSCPMATSSAFRSNLYKGIISDGIVQDESDLGERGSVEINYSFNTLNRSLQDLFEGFWYKFRPVLGVISDNPSRVNSGDSNDSDVRTAI